MIPVVQTIVAAGDVDGQVPGDCLRACVASIFELTTDQVPHFVADPRGWWPAIQAWLRPMGLWMEHDDYNEPSERPIPKGRRYPAGWWWASVNSENFPGSTHAVVMRGLYVTGERDDPDVVIHDPSPHPRRTPYLFHGARWFSALDPAVFVRRVVP